jgi:hypothetical protein
VSRWDRWGSARQSSSTAAGPSWQCPNAWAAHAPGGQGRLCALVCPLKEIETKSFIFSKTNLLEILVCLLKKIESKSFINSKNKNLLEIVNNFNMCNHQAG